MLARLSAPSRSLRLLTLLLLSGATCLDVPATPESVDAPSGVKPQPPQRPLLSGLKRIVYPPIKLFREAPPITRSWVSASVLLSVLTSTKVVDVRSICFSESQVLRRGEWWRLITNFFYMGDQFMSIFYWMQIYHFWECLKMLELVKFHWEPSGFVKMIVVNSVMLLVLKQWRRETLFLGSPLVMTFMYLYSREYESQMTNFLGFFQIRCGWLPFVQMIADGLQTGDMVPNLLGLIVGHLYYYAFEVSHRLLLPDRLPSVEQFLRSADGGSAAEGGEGGADVDAAGGGDAADDAAADAASDDDDADEEAGEAPEGAETEGDADADGGDDTTV